MYRLGCPVLLGHLNPAWGLSWPVGYLAPQTTNGCIVVSRFRGTSLGVLIVRIMISWGLYWGPYSGKVPYLAVSGWADRQITREQSMSSVFGWRLLHYLDNIKLSQSRHHCASCSIIQPRTKMQKRSCLSCCLPSRALSDSFSQLTLRFWGVAGMGISCDQENELKAQYALSPAPAAL